MYYVAKKGPNFREQNNINWDLCLKLCMEGVYNYKNTWASREGVDPCTLNEWVGTVKLLIENNIKRTDISHFEQNVGGAGASRITVDVRSTRLLQYRAVPLSTPNGAVLFRVVYTQTWPKCGWGWNMRASLCHLGEAERLRTVRK